ncbi:hypothetical protein [Parvimonas micra]
MPYDKPISIAKQQGSRAPTRCKASRRGEVLLSSKQQYNNNQIEVLI